MYNEFSCLLVLLHQIHLHLIVFDAHIEVVDVWVLEPLFLFPTPLFSTPLRPIDERRHESPRARGAPLRVAHCGRAG